MSKIKLFESARCLALLTILCQDISPAAADVASIMAHEMGHNFGLMHDDQYGIPCSCTDPSSHCIMAADSVSVANNFFLSLPLHECLRQFPGSGENFFINWQCLNCCFPAAGVVGTIHYIFICSTSMNIFSYIQPFTFIYFQKVAVIVTLNQGPNCVSKTGSVQSKGVVVTITTTFKRGDWRLPSYIKRLFCVWNGLQLNGNDSAVKQWRMRLKA